MNLASLQTALGRFRFIAITEGISYLLLLGVAMPLKYFGDMPEAVKYTGWVHGLLFILYVLFLLEVAVKRNWTAFKSLRAFVASLIPFGTFVFDRELKREAAAEQPV